MAEKNFESCIKELEDIVNRLEKGECDLDETLKLYENGVKLAEKCNNMLDKAEQKVSVLAKTENGLEEIPFENEDA